jgi:endogenous inhibitor of DNA gyrase (YacG/DUF329 family)
MNKLLKVKCPQCSTVFLYYNSEFRPFCCERCKMIDLGHWFEESYRVPDKEMIDSSKNKNEKHDEKNNRKNEEVENENYNGDYSKIDEENYDENDY